MWRHYMKPVTWQLKGGGGLLNGQFLGFTPCSQFPFILACFKLDCNITAIHMNINGSSWCYSHCFSDFLSRNFYFETNGPFSQNSIFWYLFLIYFFIFYSMLLIFSGFVVNIITQLYTERKFHWYLHSWVMGDYVIKISEVWRGRSVIRL